MHNQNLPAEPVARGQAGLSGVAKLERLRAAYGALNAEALLRAVALTEFPGQIAIASSFGSESAVLLTLVARVDPALPVLFLDTGVLFPETYQYARLLTERLGLADVRWWRPEPRLLRQQDPDGDLWLTDPDRCCYHRKVRPFRRALAAFPCWASGIKRAHGGARGAIEHLELEEGRIKVNPLAHWTDAEIQAAFRDWGLPQHPLVTRGYRSIGCVPCSRAARPGEDPRAARWDGRGKSECGIHSALFARSRQQADDEGLGRRRQ